MLILERAFTKKSLKFLKPLSVIFYADDYLVDVGTCLTLLCSVLQLSIHSH